MLYGNGLSDLRQGVLFFITRSSEGRFVASAGAHIRTIPLDDLYCTLQHFPSTTNAPTADWVVVSNSVSTFCPSIPFSYVVHRLPVSCIMCWPPDDMLICAPTPWCKSLQNPANGGKASRAKQAMWAALPIVWIH